jgi:hypothetical protein
VPVAEAIAVSVAGIVIAAVIYITLMKTNTKQPKTGGVCSWRAGWDLNPSESGDITRKILFFLF